MFTLVCTTHQMSVWGTLNGMPLPEKSGWGATEILLPPCPDEYGANER